MLCNVTCQSVCLPKLPIKLCRPGPLVCDGSKQLTGGGRVTAGGGTTVADAGTPNSAAAPHLSVCIEPRVTGLPTGDRHAAPCRAIHVHGVSKQLQPLAALMKWQSHVVHASISWACEHCVHHTCSVITLSRHHLALSEHTLPEQSSRTTTHTNHTHAPAPSAVHWTMEASRGRTSAPFKTPTLHLLATPAPHRLHPAHPAPACPVLSRPLPWPSPAD